MSPASPVKLSPAFIAIVLLAIPAPAMSQAWIGEFAARLAEQDRQFRCMMGEAPEPHKIADAKDGAQAAMQDYWTAAAGGGPRNVAVAFDGSRKARWTSVENSKTGAELASVEDGLAKPGAELGPTPESFARAKRMTTARGIWLVRERGGQPVGHYLGDFVVKSGKWRLRTLQAIGGGEPVPPAVMQYCMEPGDVEPYRASVEERQREQAAKRMEKERRREMRNAGTIPQEEGPR